MKLRNLLYKTVLLLILFTSLVALSADAIDVKFQDDFDNTTAYEPGKLLPNNSTGGKFVFTRNATVEDVDGNNIVKLQKVGNDTGRIIYDIPESWIENQLAWNQWKPLGEKIILSFDFMMREKNTNFELFNIQSYDYDLKKYYGDAMIPVKVLSDGNKIYASNRADNPIMTGIEIKKWYNIQMIIDFKNNVYSVRIGENIVENIPFAVDVANIMRVFSVTENSTVPLYVDNVEVAVANYKELDELLYKAKSIAISASVGYNDGEYPQSAVTMLKDAVDSIYNEAVKPAADESALLAQLNEALAAFYDKKINSSVSDDKVNHIRAELDEAIIVAYSENTVYDLTDKGFVCNKANEPLTGKEISWSLLDEIEGVSIQNNTLLIEPNIGGFVNLMAETAEGFYVKYKVELLPVQPVEINAFQGIDGKIVFSGKFNKKNLFPVTLRIIGDTIYHRKELAINADGSFRFEKDVPSSAQSQSLKIMMSGRDIEPYNSDEYYFGENWKDEAVVDFNGIDADNADTIIRKYAFAVELDTEQYDSNSYKALYQSRLVDACPYGDIDDIINEVKATNYIIAHKEAGRNNIESIILENLDLLSNESIGGNFDKSEFEDLSSSKKSSFYSKALQLSINEKEDSLETITDALNEILEELAEDSKRGSSGGPSGSSSGRVSIGSAPSYQITPVVKNETPGETVAPGNTAVEPFDDIDECPWAKDALLYLKAKNIMVGYENKVRPNDYVTRGEFAKIVVTAFGLTGVQDASLFSDASGMWWAEYAQVAAANNIVKGFEDGSFGGNSVINREMLATMMERLITQKQIVLYDKNTEGSFNDSEKISAYAKDAVALLYKKGIINGIGENIFAPELSVTRAQAAQVVYSVLKEM